MKWELTPQFFVSAMNFAAIVFACGSLASDVRSDKLIIEQLRSEISKLEAKDESTLRVVQEHSAGVRHAADQDGGYFI